MKRFTVTSCLTLLSVIWFLAATEHKAFGFTGYVDPGTGLMALQYIASAFAALVFFMRRRIASLFEKKTKAEATTQSSSLQDTPLNDA